MSVSSECGLADILKRNPSGQKEKEPSGLQLPAKNITTQSNK